MVEQARFDNNDLGDGAYEDRKVKASKRRSENSSNMRFDRLPSIQQLKKTFTINSHSVEEPRGDGPSSDLNDFID